jgi:hypothetical protein
MRRPLVSLIACSALLLVAFAALAAPTVSVPRPEHSFGTVFQGENVRHVFAFTNTGDARLTIDKVTSSCGCTAALASSNTLDPGQSGEIQTTFDSTRFRGEVKKTVYLYTNDPAQPMIQLYLKGTVQEELTLAPQQVNFGAVSPKKTLKSTVSLVNQGNREVRLEGLETTAPELSARLSASVIPPGGKVAVELSLTPKPGQSRFSGYVLFKASGAIQHDLRIPVYADLGERSARLY